VEKVRKAVRLDLLYGPRSEADERENERKREREREMMLTFDFEAEKMSLFKKHLLFGVVAETTNLQRSAKRRARKVESSRKDTNKNGKIKINKQRKSAKEGESDAEEEERKSK
jgi:hypothetical protein